MKKLKLKLLALFILATSALSPFAISAQTDTETQTGTWEEIQQAVIAEIEEADPNAVFHTPVYPESYPENYGEMVYDFSNSDEVTLRDRFDGNEPEESELEAFNAQFPSEGEDLGYEPNTITMNDFSIPFLAEYGNSGRGDDFDDLNSLLDQDYAVAVGNNNIHTFFGHYYDISGNGIFNPLADMELLDVGTEVIVTDENGLSKGYEITQTVEFLHPDQLDQYYGVHAMPNLAYDGNGSDMVYIQYCRWDISLGLLITNIGYRVW